MSKNQALAEDIQKAAGSITARLADAQRDIQSLQVLMNNNEELLRQKIMQAQRERAEQERLQAAREEQERLEKEALSRQEEASAAQEEAQPAQAAQSQSEPAGMQASINQAQSDLKEEGARREVSSEAVNQHEAAAQANSVKSAQGEASFQQEPAAGGTIPSQSAELSQAAQSAPQNAAQSAEQTPSGRGAQASSGEGAQTPSGGASQSPSGSAAQAHPGSASQNIARNAAQNPAGERFKNENQAERGARAPIQGRRPQAPQNAQGRPNFQRPLQGQQGQGIRPQAPGGRPQGYNRPQSAPGADRAQGQNNASFNGRPQGQGIRPQGGMRPPAKGQGGAGGLKIPSFDASLPTEKGRVSNYDPNKKMYTREHEEKRLNKKEGAPRQRGAVFEEDERVRGRKPKRKESAQQKMEPIKIEHAIMTAELISIKDLSEKLGKPASAIIKKLFLLGIMATINNEIDYDTAALVATDFGIELEQKIAKTFEETLTDAAVQGSEEDVCERPPVVTIMGHVDHGKTSLLDAIRSTNVTAHEAGGITQHIGAYTVSHNGKTITFLDTPGHEAFTSMRARGAQVTDIAILVVAADDGVMPQTIEAINHATAAKVPIIVAINKMDKPTANPERVKQELTNHGILPEEWGGDAIIVPVSAVTGEGLSDLLEMILLVADVNQYKANPDKKARGTIVEARLDKGRGPVATVLVQNGTLRVGDTIVAGTTGGRVRAMMNAQGERVEEAGPSMPVEVLGFNDVPDAGDILYGTDDDKLGRQVVQERRDKIKADQLKARAKASLDDLFNQIKEGDIKELNLIVKADVQGSVEAVRQALEKLSNEEVRINVIHGAVGAIKESDVILASASNAIIIGFNVRPDAMATAAAEAEKVDMRMYRIIYNAIEDIENAMKGMLEPEFKEVVTGHAEVRTTFKVPGAGVIAGAYITDGKIQRNAGVRLLRDNIVIHEGTISSLKRFKDDVKEVAEGFECGIGINNYNDIKENDVIEAFVQEQVKR